MKRPEMRLVATVQSGFEGELRRELTDLGIEPDADAGARGTRRGAVRFCGGLDVLYRANLGLRSASRVLRVVAEGRVRAPADVLDWLRAPELTSLIRADRDVRVHWDEPGAPVDAQIARSAAAEQVLRARPGAARRRPGMDPHAIPLVVVVRDGHATACIDTSGRALHKRGYRGPHGHLAPLKETLAATLLLRAGYDGTEAFVDPMCGTGTAAIEAALIARRKAPQAHRKRGEFAFEWLTDFEPRRWRAVQEESRARARRETPPLAAGDIDPGAVHACAAAARRARVDRGLLVYVGDALDPPLAALRAGSGLVFANPPYGARIGGAAARDRLAAFARALRASYPGWRAALLVPESDADTLALPGAHVVPVRNGALRCALVTTGALD